MSQGPNILFVICDQLIADLTGAYGHRVVQTPNLDRLASEGIRFDAAYSTCPLCAPARASLMTGRLVSDIDCFDNASPLPSDEPTFAHLLSLEGYETVLSGKMHFVGPDQLHGFQRRLTTDIYPSDFSWVPTVLDDGGWRRGGHAASYRLPEVGVRKWSWGLRFDEETHYRALECLRDHRAGARPFFLCVSYHHPHEPFHVTQDLWDRYEAAAIEVPRFPEGLDESYSLMDRWLNDFHGCDQIDIRDPESLMALRRSYYGLVTYIDRKLGELLATLESQGLAEDTAVVFVSDHGDMLAEKGMVQKRCFYEWSARVPLIVRLPGGQRAGEQLGTPVSLLDLLPTFVALAGGSIPEELSLEGADLMSLGETDTERIVFSEYHTQGVRGPCFMARSGRYKYINVDGRDEQLFDLVSDPGEWHSLVGAPEHEQSLQRLRDAVSDRFDATSIAERARRSIRERQLIKSAMAANPVDWDYVPAYDALSHYVRPAQKGE